MRETWYILEDGSFADPRDVALDGKGVLRHKGGAAVAVGPHGPRSSGVDVEEVRKKQPSKTPAAKAPAEPAAKEMKAAPPATPYKTRESKGG